MRETATARQHLIKRMAQLVRELPNSRRSSNSSCLSFFVVDFFKYHTSLKIGVDHILVNL